MFKIRNGKFPKKGCDRIEQNLQVRICRKGKEISIFSHKDSHLREFLNIFGGNSKYKWFEWELADPV